MNLYSSIVSLILIASVTDVCKGDDLLWEMGSYKDLNIEVGKSVSLQCPGDVDGVTPLLHEFRNKKALKKCDVSQADPINNGGDSQTVTFATEGTRYFCCVVGDSCHSNSKLTVNATPEGATPKTQGKKNFVITTGADCEKAAIIGKVKNKTLKTCYSICCKNRDCQGFSHIASKNKCTLFGEPTQPTERVGGFACGWRIYQDEARAEDMSLNDYITVNVWLTTDSTAGGMALIKLYLYDNMLADAPASLVTEQEIDVPAKATGRPLRVILPIDSSITQLGKTYSEMADGAYYITIDSSSYSSGLIEVSGPEFDISPRDKVSILLKSN